MSDIRDEYRALLESYVAAVARGDPKGAAAHYTEDAVSLMPGTPALHGRAAIEQNYSATLGSGIALDVTITEIQDFGDTICGTGTTKGDDLNGKWLEVLRRSRNGDLRIHRLCFTGT